MLPHMKASTVLRWKWRREVPTTVHPAAVEDSPQICRDPQEESEGEQEEPAMEVE